jgi:hypothetical protein
MPVSNSWTFSRGPSAPEWDHALDGRSHPSNIPVCRAIRDRGDLSFVNGAGGVVSVGRRPPAPILRVPRGRVLPVAVLSPGAAAITDIILSRPRARVNGRLSTARPDPVRALGFRCAASSRWDFPVPTPHLMLGPVGKRCAGDCLWRSTIWAGKRHPSFNLCGISLQYDHAANDAIFRGCSGFVFVYNFRYHLFYHTRPYPDTATDGVALASGGKARPILR